MWSHRRDSTWKGYLQIDLDPHGDALAAVQLKTPAIHGRDAMNLHEYRRRLAERASLQRLLSEISVEDVLDRSGLESRPGSSSKN